MGQPKEWGHVWKSPVLRDEKGKGLLTLRKLKLLQFVVAFFAAGHASLDDGRTPVANSNDVQTLNGVGQSPTAQPAAMARLVHVALLGAALSYLVGAALYPGGSQFDSAQVGHDHAENYLCDLFNARPYRHDENPARPLGIAALVLLAVSFLGLSIAIKRLMRTDSLAARWVPILGVLGSTGACLIFTPLHDVAISVSFGPTVVAFLLSLFELAQSRLSRLAWLGVWPLFVGSLNFTLWKMRWLVMAIPIVQKLAILGLMVWIAVVMLVVAQLPPPHRQPRSDS